MIRIGMGYDVHPLVSGRPLVLGGVTIPFEKGLQGHSDADALLHAVSDALLGALALGDLGKHFPDNDPRYKGIESLKLLGEVFQKISNQGYRVNNVDSVIIAERPRLSSFLPAMAENIARVLKIEAGQVSVKATREEGLGFTGRGEGIAAKAVVLVEKGGIP
jgi:2-C-methyl-D-erythritol 2,4-cyclodiphosphate synthase